jgi:hypothetical protein
VSATASYTLVGTQPDARHDVVVRNLDVAHAGAADEVERRLGLPLGFLVSVLKDARGELHLSVPASADIATRQFEFREAVWSGVRALTIRLLALPFSRFGSLFVREDSRVEAVTVAPAIFQPGAAALAPGMATHLEQVAAFLVRAALTVRLGAVLTQVDLDTLRRERGGAPLPDDAVRALAARRIEVVREALVARGVDGARLSGSARRVPLVEATGAPRVELDLRPVP